MPADGVHPAHVSVREAEARLPELLRRVQQGEEIVLAENGRPVARLVAAAPSPARKGNVSAVLDWLATRPDFTPRSAEEIDADIQAERDAWD